MDLAFPDFSDFNSKLLLLLVAGVIAGSTVTYMALEMDNVSGQQAAQQLETTLEAQSGQQLELVSIETQNGFYKVDLKNQDNQLTTYYITQDGQMVTQESSLSNMNQLTATVAAQQQFMNCLSNRNVTFYGNASQQATLAQIQVLGGQYLASPIYQDVNNQQVLRQTAQRGVKQVPSLYYNGSVLAGANSINQISQFTGCSFGSQ